MRGTRWLLLVAIAAILVGVGLKYRALQHAIRAQAPPRPEALPSGLQSLNQDFHWEKKGSEDLCTRAEIDAHETREVRDSHTVNLVNVKLKLVNKTCTSYDLVESDSATLFENERRMYAEGAVKIMLNIPAAGQPEHKPVSVESSSVTFDIDTGRAETDKPTHFTFEHGEGQAVGAVYDPTNRQLELKSAVEVSWKAAGPHAKPMKIEAGNLVYKEATSEVFLTPWGRMVRDNTAMNGDNVVIHLQVSDDGTTVHHTVRQILADHAHGTETDTVRKRNLTYGADRLVVDYDGTGQVQAIGADGNARLVSTAETAETTVTGNHVEMAFTVEDKESHLARVVAEGHGEITAKPLPVAGRELSETHILRSDNLEMKMRPGGREIESVITRSPGSLEFQPNLATQHHRVLDGSRMTILYGAQSRLQQFNVSDAKTHTDPTAEERKHNRTAMATASKDLVAHFDPQTGKMSSTEQSGNFTYNEGDRKASAAKATLDSDVILLETGARMSDASGSTRADRIRMDEHSGDFTAEGNVTSSRMPESDSKKNSQMLSGDEPLNAQARKMDSRDQNHVFHYEGNVVMWQGANRIVGDVVDVDRRKRVLKADGHVVTTFWDQPKKESGVASAANPKSAKKASAKPATSTVVRAPHLSYTDDDRLAIYSGGVSLDHEQTHVTSTTLRANLADSNADSRLERAFADGNVVIRWTNPPRLRVGTSQHAEYYTSDQKVILNGGRAKFEDSCKGSTEGNELTYFANDDRLLVNGKSGQPAQSRIDRACKK
jgi:lipopolysaccharide export system protein LptA